MNVPGPEVTKGPRKGAAVGESPNTRKPDGVEISIVIPVFNEEACLEKLWDRLRDVLLTLGRPWEVVFVDDGSTDDSLNLLRKIQSRESSVRILRMAGNRGQSAALDAGFRAAKGEWIVTFDADLQNPPEEVFKLWEIRKEADLVFGRRRTRKDSWIKKIGSRIGNSVRNVVTGHFVRDTGCSLKLFRASALRRIPLFHGMHRFLPTLFVFHDFRVREVEVDHQPRAGGESKYGLLDRSWKGLVDCFAVRWMRSRSFRYEVQEIEEP